MSSADIERAFGVHCSVDNFGFALVIFLMIF